MFQKCVLFRGKTCFDGWGSPSRWQQLPSVLRAGVLGCFFWELSGEGKKLAEVWGCPKLPLGKHKCWWELELSRMHGKEGVGNHRGKFYALMGLK